MSKQDNGDKMPSLWLNVFSNSKVNGAEYREDKLPLHTWAWPTDTFLQRRLRFVRANGADERVIVAQNPTLRQSHPQDVERRLQNPQRSPVARRPVDNATRPARCNGAATETGTVIEWEDVDERMAWLAKPSNN